MDTALTEVKPVGARIQEILAKVASGEISAARGAALIEIEKKRALRAAEQAHETPPGRAHWLKVRLRTEEGFRLSIPIPLALVGLALRIAERFMPKDIPVSADAIREAVRLFSAQKVGKIIEVHEDEADVEIWLY